MKATVKVSTAELARQIDLVDRRREAARLASGRIVGKVFVGFIAERAPRDTNRYVASVIQAGEDIGVSGIPRPGIVEGQHRQQFLNRLSDQAREYKDLAERLDEFARKKRAKLVAWGYINGTQKPTKWSRREMSMLRKLEADAERAWRRAGRAAEEMLKAMGDKTFLAIFGSNGKVNAKGRLVGQRMMTVRVGVYGGYGRMIVSHNRTSIQIVSREPHATILERRRKLFAQAMNAVSVFGVKRLKRGYFDEAAAASKLFRGARVAA